MINKLIQDNKERIGLLITRLGELRNADGGFKGYHAYDVSRGLWTTAEIAHIVAKTNLEQPILWLKDACEYLAVNQNDDGGWGFRSGGKSITDITAWTCLALSHLGYDSAIRAGLEFILQARKNKGNENEDGWGLTTFEPDRVYSTWISSYAICRLLPSFCNENNSKNDLQLCERMKSALGDAKTWLLKNKNSDGGWGAIKGEPSKHACTALALLTLFMQGEDPKAFRSSCEFLKSGQENNLWELTREIVITREGYELPQEWFTSAFCFRVFIYFAEMKVLSIEELDDVYTSFVDLIDATGDVRPARGASLDLIWTIPYMLEALDKFGSFLQSNRSIYNKYLQRKSQEAVERRKAETKRLLYQQFPYPISHVFSQYEHEIDFHRKFQLTLQVYEVAIKYVTIVCLAGSIAARESLTEIQQIMQENFKRPGLGDWARLLEFLLNNSEKIYDLFDPWRKSDISRKVSDISGKSAASLNLSQALSRIVSTRNTWAGHGAMRSLYEYKLKTEDEECYLYSFIDRFRFLAEYNSFLVLASNYDEFAEGDHYSIRVFNGLSIQDDDLMINKRLAEGQRDQMIRYLYFHNTKTNKIANLYPFLSYMFCPECKREKFFFYNSVKGSDIVSYLSFECGHSVQCNNFEHFQRRLAIGNILW